jgi:hypothetical protein
LLVGRWAYSHSSAAPTPDVKAQYRHHTPAHHCMSRYYLELLASKYLHTSAVFIGARQPQAPAMEPWNLAPVCGVMLCKLSICSPWVDGAHTDTL